MNYEEFEEFNEQFNTDSLMAEIEKLKTLPESGFVAVPSGKYEVRLKDLRLKKSKTSQLPMVAGSFTIIDGEHEGERIYLNQSVTKAFQIKIINELLSSMETAIKVEFVNFVQYAEMLSNVTEDVKDKVFILDYRENDKGFKVYTIEKIITE